MSRPLDGFRVMDVTLAAVGPWTTMLLGALGAEVMKVEPLEGEIGRLVPPPMNGISSKHIHCNLNKKSTKLNLKDPKEHALALKLAETADIFVENMRPGTIARLGLGYETVSKLNPKIVYCSLSGYGQRGPMAFVGAVDPQIQAFCGWSSITGAPGSQGEVFRHFAHMDLSTASYAVSAILMALYERGKSGLGQKIELSMTEATYALQTTRLAEYFATGASPVPLGSAAATTAPNQAFLCQDKKYIAVSAENDTQWRRLCCALGRSDLTDDARFRTNPDRVAHREELACILGEIFKTKVAEWWLILLRRNAVPAGNWVIDNFDLIRYHAQNIENQHVSEVDTHWGRLCVGGIPWKFQKTPAFHSTAALPGEHTRQLYEEFGECLDEDRTEHVGETLRQPIDVN